MAGGDSRGRREKGTRERDQQSCEGTKSLQCQETEAANAQSREKLRRQAGRPQMHKDKKWRRSGRRVGRARGRGKTETTRETHTETTRETTRETIRAGGKAALGGSSQHGARNALRAPRRGKGRERESRAAPRNVKLHAAVRIMKIVKLHDA